MGKHFVLWKTLSYAWTEIGLNEAECSEIVRELENEYQSWSEIKDVIYKDVLGGFSLLSLSLCFVWIPFVGWFFANNLLLDWGFDDEWIQKKIQHWYAVPRWRHYLNPLRWFGYILALIFASYLIFKIKKFYLSEKST